MDTFGLVVFVESCEFVCDEFHEGTVVADEHHYESFAATDIAERDSGTIDIREAEIWGGGTERQHGAGCFNHRKLRIRRWGWEVEEGG